MNRQQLTALPEVDDGLAAALRVLNIKSNKLGECTMAGWRPLAALKLLERLSLESNGLGTVSDEVFVLKKLAVLTLAHNSLHEVPYAVGRLRLLVELNVSHNSLSMLPPLTMCPSLARLNISDNRFTKLPDSVDNAASLTELRAGNNMLQQLSPRISALRRLTRLDLAGNELETLPAALGTLTQLTKLNLDHNSLSAVCPEIGNLSALLELTLCDNDLVALPPSFVRLSALRSVDLADNSWHCPEHTSIEDIGALREFVAKEPPPEAPTAAAGGGGFKFPVAATAAAANGTDHKRSLTSVSPAAERRKHEIEKSREARRRLRESTSSAVGAAALSKTAAPSPLSHSPPPTADASSSSASAASATTTAKTAASWYGLRRIGSKSANYISMGVERRAEALSEQDAAFVLDTRNVVYVWIGAKCEQARGRKAVVLAQLLAQEGQADGSKSKVGVAVLDYARVVKPSAPSHDDEERFWQDFDGSSRKQHARPHKGTAEEEAVVAKNKELDGQLLSLFIVNCSASGRPDVSGHPLQKLSRQYLTSDKSFLVDDQVDVWVWSGRCSDTQSRNWAW